MWFQQQIANVKNLHFLGNFYFSHIKIMRKVAYIKEKTYFCTGFNQINKINHNYDSINIYNNRCCDSFISDYILNMG